MRDKLKNTIIIAVLAIATVIVYFWHKSYKEKTEELVKEEMEILKEINKGKSSIDANIEMARNNRILK